MLIMLITSFVYAGTKYFLDTRMDGSYLALFLIAFVGAIALLSMGLLVEKRGSIWMRACTRFSTRDIFVLSLSMTRKMVLEKFPGISSISSCSSMRHVATG